MKPIIPIIRWALLCAAVIASTLVVSKMQILINGEVKPVSSALIKTFLWFTSIYGSIVLCGMQITITKNPS